MRRLLLLCLLVVCTLPAAGVAAQTPTPTPTPTQGTGPNCSIVPNCDFEQGLTGWQDKTRGSRWSTVGGAYQGSTSAYLSGNDYTARAAQVELVQGQQYIISAWVLFTHAQTSIAIDIIPGTDINGGSSANCPVYNPGPGTWVQCVNVFSAQQASTFVSVGSDTWQGAVYVDQVAIVPYVGPNCPTSFTDYNVPGWTNFTTITVAAGDTIYPLYNAPIYYYPPPTPPVPPPDPRSGLAARLWPNGQTFTGDAEFAIYNDGGFATARVCHAAAPTPTAIPTPDAADCPSYTDHTLPAWPAYVQIPYYATSTAYPLASNLYYASGSIGGTPPEPGTAGAYPIVGAFGFASSGVGRFYADGALGVLRLCTPTTTTPTPGIYPTPDPARCPNYVDHTLPAWPQYVQIPFYSTHTAYPLSGSLYYATGSVGGTPPEPGTPGAYPITGAFDFVTSGVGRFYDAGGTGVLRLCDTAATRTPTATATRTTTPTATPTATITPTATVTPRPTLTVGTQICREYTIPEGAPVEIIDIWQTTQSGPSPAQVFNVSSPAGLIMYGDITVPPSSSPPPMQFDGEYLAPGTWRFSYFFSGSNAGKYAILRVCLPSSQLPTATATATPTATPTATATATPTATATATSAAFPTVSTPNPGPQVTALPAPTSNTGELPDLAIVLPTLVPLECPTVTIVISGTAMIAVVQTMQAGISTPVAVVQTASAPYGWDGGTQTAASWTVQLGPALGWLALLNPANPAWSVVGGPVWALAPLLLPILPLIAAGLIIVFIRFFLWLYGWFLKFVDLVIKLIELIPGE